MEMINYAPKQIDPNFEAINRTINKQRDAMIARANQKKIISGQAPLVNTEGQAKAF